MTRVRHTCWIVVECDPDGWNQETHNFSGNKQARAVVALWRSRKSTRVFSDPTRVTVLLPRRTA